MNPEFRDAYLNLFYEYPRQAFEYINPRYYPDDDYDFVRELRNRIVQLNDDVSPNRRMRPDAMYFLLVNVHHMIVRPIIEVSRRNKYFRNYREDILDDLNIIVQRAFEESRERQVSGHAILAIVNDA